MGIYYFMISRNISIELKGPKVNYKLHKVRSLWLPLLMSFATRILNVVTALIGTHLYSLFIADVTTTDLASQGFFLVSSGAEIRPLSQWDLGDFFSQFDKKIPISKKKKKKKFFLEFSFSHHTHTSYMVTIYYFPLIQWQKYV